MRKVLAVISMVFVLISCTLFSVSAETQKTLDFRTAVFKYNYGTHDNLLLSPSVGNGNFSVSVNPIPASSTEILLYVDFPVPVARLTPGQTYYLHIMGSLGRFGKLDISCLSEDQSEIGIVRDVPLNGSGEFDEVIELKATDIANFQHFVFRLYATTYYSFRVTVDSCTFFDYSPSAEVLEGIREQTEQFDHWMNDYESPRPGMGEEVQGAEDDYNNAVDNALGGKSEDEIQQDVENAADFDFDSLDQNSVSGVKSFMEGLLDVLGSDYMALLLFSCTMGVCIYVIGRKRGT